MTNRNPCPLPSRHCRTALDEQIGAAVRHREIFGDAGARTILRSSTTITAIRIAASTNWPTCIPDKAIDLRHHPPPLTPRHRHHHHHYHYHYHHHCRIHNQSAPGPTGRCTNKESREEMNIGIDLLHLPRLRMLLTRPPRLTATTTTTTTTTTGCKATVKTATTATYLNRFARRILTSQELSLFQQKTRPLFLFQNPVKHQYRPRQQPQQHSQQQKQFENEEDSIRWLGVRFAPPTTTTTTTYNKADGEGGRWAAKEAAFKAGGLGRARLLWKEVEVCYLPSGQPYLHLPNEGVSGGLSISHDGDYVVAMAMLPSPPPPPPPHPSQAAAAATGARAEAAGLQTEGGAGV